MTAGMVRVVPDRLAITGLGIVDSAEGEENVAEANESGKGVRAEADRLLAMDQRFLRLALFQEDLPKIAVGLAGRGVEPHGGPEMRWPRLCYP